MAIKMTGEWDFVGKALNEKARTFDKIGEKPLVECAELYRDTLVNKIQNQEFDWKELSSQYRKRKMAMGLGDKILIATGDYVSKLKVHKMKSTVKGKQIFVGASENDIHEPSGLTMKKIAQIMEYGTKDGRIPPRPHFKATWDEVRPKCRGIWLRVGREFFRWR